MTKRVIRTRYGIPRKAAYTESITFNTTAEMKDEIERIAADNDCTISYALRYAVNLLKAKCRKAQLEEEVIVDDED